MLREGDAKVDDLRLPGAGHHDVVGLDVAMKHAGGVGLHERRGHLGDQSVEVRSRQSSRDFLTKRPSLDQLHRDVLAIVVDPNLVDRDDAWDVQRREGTGLAAETLPGHLGSGHRRVDHLDGHPSSQVGVLGHEDLAHRPGAERPHDAVTTNLALHHDG